MSFTLTTLKTAVQDYMESSETTFTSQLNTIIKAAEDRIFDHVQLPVQRKNVQGQTTASNRFLATPSDFYAPFSAAIITGSTVTGRPKYYSLLDDTAFELSPIPDAAYTVEVHYLYKPASLTSGADSGTTVLSTDYPEALLYGTLAEASVFLKEAPDVIGVFEMRFKEALARMKNLSEGRKQRDEYRYDALRQGVS